MKLARLRSDEGDEFAVRAADDEAWVPLRELGVHAQDTPEVISRWAEVTEAYASAASAGGTKASTSERLASPIVRPGKVLAIGLNYMDHIRETNATPPERPIVFAKYSSALNGPFDPILIDDRLTGQVDYEAELAVIIGRRARRLQPGETFDHIFGYAVADDVSARDLQKSDGQFSRSKSFDTFCPIGPWITTVDHVADPQQLDISATVNGEVRQNSSTGQMLFTVDDLLVFLSSTMTLEPGDVVLTGTPPGVGLGRKPPTFLGAGDVVRCEIDGLGHIENAVVADPGSRAPVIIRRQALPS